MGRPSGPFRSSPSTVMMLTSNAAVCDAISGLRSSGSWYRAIVTEPPRRGCCDPAGETINPTTAAISGHASAESRARVIAFPPSTPPPGRGARRGGFKMWGFAFGAAGASPSTHERPRGRGEGVDLQGALSAEPAIPALKAKSETEAHTRSEE